MCPSTSNASAGRSSEENKPDSCLIQSKSSSNPSLQLISVTQKSATASVKSINVSPIPIVGSHCHADFIIGNHKWIQRCMIGPGANINCFGYDWITRFETPAEWNYNLERGPVKTAGGYKLEADSRVLLKISWNHRTQFSQLISGSTWSMVKMESYLAPLVAELLESLTNSGLCLHWRKEHRFLLQLSGQFTLTLFTLHLSVFA